MKSRVVARTGLKWALYGLWLLGSLAWVWLVLGFAGCARPAELPAPCDTASLERYRVDCRARVRAECERPNGIVDPWCPTLRECDAGVDRWQACRDADAGAAGGAP